jgi:hypothetical protein
VENDQGILVEFSRPGYIKAGGSRWRSARRRFRRQSSRVTLGDLVAVGGTGNAYSGQIDEHGQGHPSQSRPEMPPTPTPLVTRITYINVVNGRIMIPRHGRIHNPPKTTLKATGRANYAKMRNIWEKLARNPAKQSELFCCLIFNRLLVELLTNLR